MSPGAEPHASQGHSRLPSETLANARQHHVERALLDDGEGELGPDRSIGILPKWGVSGSCGLEPCETNEEPTREGRDRPVNPTVAVRKEAPW